MNPTLRTQLLFVCILLGLFSATAQLGFAQNALTFENNFFVTGDYAVGGVSLVGQANKVQMGYAVGTISIGGDTNPGVKGANNSVPAGADIIAALLYWQTIEIIGGSTGQNGFFRPVFNGGPSGPGYAIQGVPLKNSNGTVYWDGSGCAASSSPKQLVTYVASVGPYLRQDANGNSVAGNTGTPQSYEIRLPSQSNGAPLTFGATLVIIYRVMSPNFPLNAITILDGTFSPDKNLLRTSDTLQGFFQSDGLKAKLTYIAGNGQKNSMESVSLNNMGLASPYSGQPPFPGYYTGGQWDNVTWTFTPPNDPVPAGSPNPPNAWPSQTASTVLTSTKMGGCVTTAAIVFSTTVANPDNDGLLPVWKNSKGYCDAASANGTGVCTVNNANSGWVSLADPADQPRTGRKDVFVQLDSMVDSNGHPLLIQDNVNAAITRVKNAYLGAAENVGGNNSHNVHLHVFQGNAINEQEQLCIDPAGNVPVCAFPSQPGVVSWKDGFTTLKNKLVSSNPLDNCTQANPPVSCQPRFQHGKKDSWHYVLLGHAPGLTGWNMVGGSLTSVQQTGNSVTFTSSTPTGPLDAVGVVVPTSTGGLTTLKADGTPSGNPPPTDPTCTYGRVTVYGATTNPNLNGTYCVQNPTDTTTKSFTINIGGSAVNTSYTLATDPNISVAPGYVTTVSGVSDEGGEDSLITLASWGGAAYPTADPSSVIAGTLMHEWGHSNGLTHGGFSFTAPNPANPAAGDYRPVVEANCKPNFQSVMSYTRQFDLLQYLTGYQSNIPQVNNVVDYSEQQLDNLGEGSISPANIFPSAAPFYFYTSWYGPTSVVGGKAAIAHCDGSNITDGAQYNITTGPAVPPTAPHCPSCNVALNWSALQDINFNGNNSDTLKGYSDWANIDFRQVGATGSLSSTGGKLLNQGGHLLNQGGKLLNQGGKLLNQGGKLLNQGGSEINFATANSTTRPPSQLTAAEDVSPRLIHLQWNAPTFGVIGAYNIYRQDGGTGSFNLIHTNAGTPPSTSYTDTVTCNAGGYRYEVTAVLAGTTQESAFSNIAPPTGQPLITGCYTVPSFSAPASAVQGQVVPVTFTLQDDFYPTNGAVNTAGAITNLYAVGPVGTDETCSTVQQGRIQLVKNGLLSMQTVGLSTFPAASGGVYTFNLDTDVVPFCAGSYTFELDLDSSQTFTTAAAMVLSIDVTDNDNIPVIHAIALPKAIAGVPYSYQVPEHGGTAPLHWSIVNNSGTLPPGLTLDANSGTVSGTATDVGTYSFTAKVTDANNNSGTQALSILAVAPVSLIHQPVAPESLTLGGAAPTLTVNGEGFYAGSKVLWNGSALATNVVSTNQLTATVPGPDVTNLGTASISVANKNSPNSNVDFFQVSDPIPSVSFSAGTEDTGASPQAVIAADFDGDGKLDLAIVNSTDNTVSILIGNGDGTFTAKPVLNTGGDPYALAAGDFDGDGKLDLAVANFGNNTGNTVSIFKGNGDGTFTAAATPTVTVGTGPVSIVAADFDRDGHLDLAVANQNTATVSILLGNGDGTFKTKVDYPAGTTDVAAIAVGDFNADNTLDLAVTNPSSDTVSVLLGNGDGTFKAAHSYSTGNPGNHPTAVSSLDVNGDGKLDLAVTNLNAKQVAILLGDGTGAFQVNGAYSTTTGINTGPNGIASGDFNADGKLDLAITNQSNKTLSVLFGNNDATFQAPVETDTGNFAAGVAAGDFIGNGRLDLAVANLDAGKVSILLERPQPPTNLTPGAVTATQAALSWTASTSTTVTGYNVYRSTTSGSGYTKVNASPVNATSYTDTSVASGTKYYYVVTAADSAILESVVSNEVSVITPPLPPTGVAAGSPTTNSLTLTWTVSPTASVTSYDVFRGATTGGPYTQVGTHVASGYVDSGLTSGTTYYYVVRAFGLGNLESVDSSPEASGTTLPLAPTSLGASATLGQPTLSWTASTTTSVTGYNVYRSTSSGAETGPAVGSVAGRNTTTFSDTTPVTPGTTYYYVVRAIGPAPSNLESPNSNEASVTPPLAPTSLTAAATANPGEIQLNFNGVGGASGYNVYRGGNPGGPYTQIASGWPSSTYTDLGLTTGVTYFYVVTAVVGPSNAESGYSNEASATAP